MKYRMKPVSATLAKQSSLKVEVMPQKVQIKQKLNGMCN